MSKEQIREPAVAGSFYPGDPAKLKKDVQKFLGGEPPRPIPSSRIRGIISPHAGYMFSGATAGMAYRYCSSESYETVVVVGPSHYDMFTGASIYGGKAYRTPLGDIPLDTASARQLAEQGDLVRMMEMGHREEHSIEVQLPFLQEALGSFTLVPVAMGDQGFETISQLSDLLASVFKGKNVLLVASSDLSHYHSYAKARELDAKVIGAVERFDPGHLSELFRRGEAEACGAGPMIAVMRAARSLGASQSMVVHACNSGDTTRDRSRVVGYMSALLYC